MSGVCSAATGSVIFSPFGGTPPYTIDNITSNQMDKLIKMDSGKKKFFMNERVYANDEEKDLMEGLAYVFNRRIEGKTNKGIQMDTFTNETYQKALTAAKKLEFDDPDAQLLGQEILQRITIQPY